MSIKHLFFTREEDSSEKPKKVEETNTQPKSSSRDGIENSEASNQKATFFGFGSSPTPSFTPTTNLNSEELNKAIELYERGFNSLNQSGYDFFEYFKAVEQVGIDNPQIYTMAFAMGKAMDGSITKEKLLQQCEFYLSEINKVYNDYVQKGEAKKTELVNQKNNENKSLVDELGMLNQQMEALKVQIQDRQNKLNAIDSKYGPMISDIETKLLANDGAKNHIIQKIQQVKNGINSNLK